MSAASKACQQLQRRNMVGLTPPRHFGPDIQNHAVQGQRRYEALSLKLLVHAALKIAAMLLVYVALSF
jgi:hypothetical protein